MFSGKRSRENGLSKMVSVKMVLEKSPRKNYSGKILPGKMIQGDMVSGKSFQGKQSWVLVSCSDISSAKKKSYTILKLSNPVFSYYSFLIHAKNEDISSFKVYQNIFSFVFNDPLQKHVFLQNHYPFDCRKSAYNRKTCFDTKP